MKNEREMNDKMAARAFAQSYLDDLVPSVFSLLVEQGFFFDAAERGVYVTIVHGSMSSAWFQCFLVTVPC